MERSYGNPTFDVLMPVCFCKPPKLVGRPVAGFRNHLSVVAGNKKVGEKAA